MKNKFKKILAGVALCTTMATGVASISGCSLNDDQLSKIDSLTESADTLINLVENQNKKITKEEAFDIIQYIKSDIGYGLDYNNVYCYQRATFGSTLVEAKHKMDKGLNESYAKIYSIMDIKNNIAYGYQNINNGGLISIDIRDYKNEEAYNYCYEAEANKYRLSIENISDVYNSSIPFGNFFKDSTMGSFDNVDDILDIKVVDGGYEISFINKVSLSFHDNEDGTFSPSEMVVKGTFYIKDNKFILTNYISEQTFYDDVEVIPKKDEDGNYDTSTLKKKDMLYSCVKLEVQYDDEIDMKEFDTFKALAEQAYDEKIGE